MYSKKLEIQGLRATAVLMVIFYHTHRFYFDDAFEFFKGGYIGVDIFFVISGYLITKILLNEVILKKKISIKEFYIRRIRRIVPLLFFVTIILFPFVYYLYIPNLIEDFSKSALYLLIFNSNLYFYLSGLSYQSYDSIIKPLLHTWSLCIEFQFYIFYPILLLFLNKFCRRYILHFLFFILIISFFIAEIGSNKFASLNFYLMPSRLWEFIAGAIIAYNDIKKIKYLKDSVNFSFLGIFLILLSFLLLNKNTPHPSLLSFFAVLGTCLIIYSNKKNSLVIKVLSNRLLVGIGEISYSLYLTHFPILLFGKILNVNSNYLFILIILIFLISIFTYFFIEKYSRNRKISFCKIFFVIIALSISILFVNLLSINQKGFLKKYSYHNYNIDKQRHLEYHNKILYNFKTKKIDKSKKNILVIGNSHGFDFLNILSRSNLKKDLNFLYSNTGKHIQLVQFYNFLKNKKNKNIFEDFFKYSNTIVIATKWRKEDLDVIEQVIKQLKFQKKNIVLISHSIESQTDTIFDLNRLDRFVFKYKRLPNNLEILKISQELYDDTRLNGEKNIILKNLAKKYLIPFFEQRKYFCNEIKKKCPIFTNGKYPIYWDYGHLTKEGYSFFAEKINLNPEILNFFSHNLN